MLITEIITLDTHSTATMTIYGCVANLRDRRHVRCAWWMMLTAVKAAHAVEKPKMNETSAKDSDEGSSTRYHDGTSSPPMLLGVAILKNIPRQNGTKQHT